MINLLPSRNFCDSVPTFFPWIRDEESFYGLLWCTKVWKINDQDSEDDPVSSWKCGILMQVFTFIDFNVIILRTTLLEPAFPLILVFKLWILPLLIFNICRIKFHDSCKFLSILDTLPKTREACGDIVKIVYSLPWWKYLCICNFQRGSESTCERTVDESSTSSFTRFFL